MSLSSAVNIVFVSLVGVACVFGTVDDMGPCVEVCDVEKDFDFDKFATEEGGSWKYQLVPNLPFFDPIKYAGVKFTPTGKKGVFNITIYNILYTGETETFSDGQVTYLGEGRAVNNATETGEGNILFKYTYLKYEPCCCLYYYVCTDKGNDKTCDYRNVLVHKPLSKEKVKELVEFDKKFKWKTQLRELDVEA